MMKIEKDVKYTKNTPFPILTIAPKNHIFGSTKCLRKYSRPLKGVTGAIDTNPQDKHLAVLFLRTDCPSRSSFQDKSTDNSSYKMSMQKRAFKYYKKREATKHKKCSLWKNPTHLQPTNKEILVDNPETVLMEQASEYSICTICDLKKKKKVISPTVEQKTSLVQQTTDTEDSEQYQECVSNLSSTHSISSDKNPKMLKHNGRDLMYKKNIMLTRETQTSFSNSDAGSAWTQTKEYDRAITIDYGRSNYLSYKNVFQNKNGHLSVDISKDETDVEAEYMINCLKYSLPDARYSFSHDKCQGMGTASKLNIKQDKNSIHRNNQIQNCKQKVQRMSTMHLAVCSKINKLLPDDKLKSHKTILKSKYMKANMKPTHNKKQLQKTALPDMHARAMSFIKKNYNNEHSHSQHKNRSDYKNDESFHKIKLLEMAGKEIMGLNYATDDWNKRKSISHKRTILKHKLPLNSFTYSGLSPNLIQNSSYIIGSYQKPAPLTSSVKLNVKKTGKLKG